ncbi:hypothetical protein BN159_3331 [Streptomyces davaonensis JCM 4913]|uniref:Uncharacterized protein n=1 Tax=Streptomyces davaonensis (strain DSM 101723 / JCM 4913 / KCC S-0913 / 768) TaxID=1214101 RepID=K4R3N9_STRDJ|nr:hypothetical protein [Streptomyces davaonensis]CCK27710.1 hypothetical protein BN159_3331 [Streptomyces davaonensis JCM 4913]
MDFRQAAFRLHAERVTGAVLARHATHPAVVGCQLDNEQVVGEPLEDGALGPQALASWLIPAPVSGWRHLPASVTATTGASPDVRRLHVVHNWSRSPTEVQSPWS